MGLGTTSGSITFGGTPFNGCGTGQNITNCPVTYQTLAAGNKAKPPISTCPGTQTITTSIDLRGCSSAQTITNDQHCGNCEVLGGSGLLTYNDTTPDKTLPPFIYPGPGGAIITIAHAVAPYFLDQAGFAPSSVTQQNLSESFVNADGDTLTYTGPSTTNDAFVNVAGRNVVIEGAANNCGGTCGIGSTTPGGSGNVVYWKNSFGYPPSGQYDRRFTQEQLLCLVSCNLYVTGNAIAMNDGWDGYYVVPALTTFPAIVQYNLTAWNIGGGKLTSSQPDQFSGEFCSGALGLLYLHDYSDKTCSGFMYLTSVGQTVFLTNATADMGTDAGSISFASGIVAVATNPTVIPGTAAVTMNTTGGPTTIEIIPTSMTGIHGGYHGDIMPAHLGNGGTLTVPNYVQTSVPSPAVITLGGMSQASCTLPNFTYTDTIADTQTLVLTDLTSCAGLNTTPPAGSQAGTLSGPASVSGTHGTTVGVNVTWSDSWMSGATLPWPPFQEGYVRVCSLSGSVVFNGSSTPAPPATSGCPAGYTGITAAAHYSGLSAALAGLQLTLGAAGTSTLTVDVWNSGGQHLTLSIPVTST
jgi:hypothetical protein